MKLSSYRQLTFLAITTVILLNGMTLGLLSFGNDPSCSPCTAEQLKEKQMNKDLKILAMVSFCTGGLMLFVSFTIFCYCKIIKLGKNQLDSSQTPENTNFEESEITWMRQGRNRAPPTYQEVLRMKSPAIITGSAFCIPFEAPPKYNSIYSISEAIEDINQGWQIQLITRRTDLIVPVLELPVASNTSGSTVENTEL